MGFDDGATFQPCENRIRSAVNAAAIKIKFRAAT